MKSIHKPWIRLKEHIDAEDYELINKLQDRCIEVDQTSLKLELDYKLGVSNGESSGLRDINEFMYFEGERLIGYIGISSFAGPWEVNGMVDPDYRRQGIFTKLYQLVEAEWKRRNSGSMLLLCDRLSEAGQSFIRKTGGAYKHSEYEMFLKKEAPNRMEDPELLLRKAANADAREIARQNAIYFNEEFTDDHEQNLILPEEEERRGMTSYLAEKDHEIIGKVNLQLTSRLGAIFGLGVLPEHRRKGYGRALLLLAIEKLQEAGAKEIMLQVAAENANALSLYQSCGFVETSTMDYFEIR